MTAIVKADHRSSAEFRVLGRLLKWPELLDGCELKIEDFGDERARLIFRSVQQAEVGGIFGVGHHLQSLNVLDAVGGPMFLHDLAGNEGTKVGFDYMCKVVKGEARHRAAVGRARAVWEHAQSQEASAGSITGQMVQAAADMSSDGAQDLEWFDCGEAYEDDSPYETPLVGPDFLFPGDLCVVFGPPKSQKSWLMLDVCTHWALGHGWLDVLKPTRPLNIAYVQFEVRRDGWRRRVKQRDLAPDDLANLKRHFAVTERCAPELDDAFGATLKRSLGQRLAGPVDVLVIDPLANIFGGNENDNAEMAAFLRRLKRARDVLNPDAAIVIVHHTAKVGKEQRNEDPFATVRGASALRGSWDSAVFIDRIAQDSAERFVDFELRNGAEPPRMNIELVEGRFLRRDRVERAAGQTMGERWDEEAARKMGELLDVLKAEARQGRAWTARAFAEEFAQKFGLGSRSGINARPVGVAAKAPPDGLRRDPLRVSAPPRSL